MDDVGSFFRESLDLMAVADLDGYFKRVNPAWERTLGWPIDDLLSRPWIDFVHPDDRAATIAEEKKLARGQTILEFENRYCCRDGTYRWLSWRVPAPSPGSTRLYATARDVTDRKRADNHIRVVVEASPSAMVMIDGKGKICLANSQTEQIFGYERAELLGQGIEILMPHRFRKGHLEARTDFLSNPRVRAMGSGRDLYGLRKDGTEIPIEIGLNPLSIEDETFVLAAIVDISERKRTQELEQTRARLEATLVEREHYADRLAARSAVTAVLSEGGMFEDVTPKILKAVCESLKWALGEVWMVDPKAHEIHYVHGWSLPALDLEEFENAARQVKWPLGTGISGSVWASGKSTWIEDVAKDAACPRTELAAQMGLHGAFAFPIINENRVIAVMMFFSLRVETPDKDSQAMMADLGSQIGQFLVRQRLRSQLEQLQKMDSIGRLTAGIAHDFNNLLTVVNGYSELMLAQIRPGEPLWSDVQEILNAGQRASSLTRQLLAFSRNQILIPKVFDLNQIVRDMERLLKRLIGEDINLVCLLARDLDPVKADPGQLEQVIMNLGVNARDAMPKGGKLTIETANVQLDEAYARSHVSVAPGHYVMLAISDNGVGMDRETLAHLFEPFFTTKEKGKGTGLGLATVYGIVKQSGGNIWVYSEPGQGTTFKIYFPRVQEPVEAVSRQVPPAMPRGSETLLLVEDDAAVRKLASSILRRNGYTVLEAGSGPEALEIVVRHSETIRLLITDVVMPGMSGRDLSKRMSEIRPGLPVLYLSGYTSNAIVHHGVLDSGVDFLQKPFTAEGLARKVREVLDAP